MSTEPHGGADTLRSRRRRPPAVWRVNPMLYFAYGANMDRAAMAVRCPASKPLGVAKLPGWRLAVMREGWLTVAPAPGASTQGVLWELADQDAPGLDAFEDVGEGLYLKRTLEVIAERDLNALVYVGSNAGPGSPRADYFANVLAAAAAWEIPPEGVEALKKLAQGASARNRT